MNSVNTDSHPASPGSSSRGAAWQAWAYGLAGLAAGLLAALGIWMGSSASSPPSPASASFEQILNAGNGTANDAFAVCTGPVADGEGLFMLDFVTGQLTCVVLHPRSGKFLARFSTNVVANFATDATKKPRYLLTSGAMDFRGGSGSRFAQSVVYVVDANTGTFAAYGIPWNQNVWNNVSPIAAQLVVLDAGRARNIAVGE